MVTTISRKRMDEIKQKLKHTIEEDTGERTTLKKTNIKEEKISAPGFCGNFGTYFFIVVKNELTDRERNVKPSQCKLDKIVTNRTVRVLQIKPRDNNLSLVEFCI